MRIGIHHSVDARAVLMEAAIILQSSRLSAIMATMFSGESMLPLSNDFKPYRRFQFLEHDFKLMNEIGAAFCAARLAIVGSGGGSGSQNLTADMAALRCSWQL